MKNRKLVWVVGVAAAGFIFGGLGGCSMTRPEQKDSALKEAGSFRDELGRMPPQIDRTIASLYALQSDDGGNKSLQVQQYDKDVSILQQQALSISKQSQELEANGFEYFRNWQRQISGASTAQSRELSAAERATEQSRYRAFIDAFNWAKQDYNKMSNKFLDIENVVNKDTSRATLNSLSDEVAEAGLLAAGTKDHIAALTKLIDDAIARNRAN